MEWGNYLCGVVMIGMEELCVFLNVHSVNKRNIKFSKLNIIFILFFFVYYMVINTLYYGYDENNLFTVVMTLIIFVWSKLEFKQKPMDCFIKTILAVILVAIQQALSMLVVSALKIFERNGEYTAFVCVSVISFVISIIIYVLVIKPKIKISPVFANIIGVGVMLTCFIFILWLRTTFDEINIIYEDILFVCCAIMLIAIIAVYINVNVTRELRKKELELELNNKYMKTYEDLILSMRQKQHDYKNQLGALYSMHLVAKDKEQLVQLQRDYGDELNAKDEVDSILFQGDNPVICGYVYSKCIMADKQGVKIEPHMSYGEGDFTVPLHKLIEILGILVDNAVEYLSELPKEDKLVKLDIGREQDKLYIQVSNIVKDFNYDDLDKIFKPGYTTKGKERGIGLSSLKAIVKEYKGDIMVDNNHHQDKDWLRIKVTI